jgi:integrase
MTISKKNGKYYCRFQINGERHHYLCSGASSISDALKIERALMFKTMQEQGGLKERELKNISFNKLKQLYLEYAKNNNRSYKNIEYYVKFLENYFGTSVVMQKIKPKDIEDFKKFLLDKGKKHSTVNRYLEILSKMFNIGISNKLLKENPVSQVKKLLEDNHKIRFLTVDEEKRLFEHLPAYLKPIVICALQTGMRRGEIFNLKWSNIDFDYGFIELLETKSGKSRKIPISDTLRTVLNGLDKTSDYVFINPETGKHYVDIKKAWTSALKAADIEDFRFHDLRHTVATRLVEKGIDLLVVKDILGHAKIETTMRYSHPVPKRKLEAISVLNSYN